jgi:hypothetical protein
LLLSSHMQFRRVNKYQLNPKLRILEDKYHVKYTCFKPTNQPMARIKASLP